MEVSQQDYLDAIISFDYGNKRIGVALKASEESSPEPLLTLNNDSELWKNIEDLLNLHQPDLIVVGRPRNLDGENTQQTELAEKFASELTKLYNNKIELIDEALSTEQAKQRIPKHLASKSRDVIDQYAACIILESYLREK
ncbi:MAG: Holliday junction resolvase RuvX [Candidatus Saccharibacteria bacterium]